MKKLSILLSTLLISSSVYAAPTMGMNENMFQEFKNFRMQMIQKRIAIEQTHLSCVQGAQRRDDMRMCEQTAHQAMESLKSNEMQQMQGMRAQFRSQAGMGGEQGGQWQGAGQGGMHQGSMMPAPQQNSMGGAPQAPAQ